VLSSLVALKGLTHAPTGDRDRAHCVDAVLTLGAFMQCGYADEALAFRDWLLRATCGRPSDLRIMYGIAGERRLPEEELDWLPGYENSSPVRAGNGAAEQFQLDV
jgi:GH15 family glucan-1,4-alpha-glucosidase